MIIQKCCQVPGSNEKPKHILTVSLNDAVEGLGGAGRQGIGFVACNDRCEGTSELTLLVGATGRLGGYEELCDSRPSTELKRVTRPILLAALSDGISRPIKSE